MLSLPVASPLRRALLPGLLAAVTLLVALAPGASAAPGGGPAPYADSTQAERQPFVAGIRFKTQTGKRFFCTGSLVHRQWVLTAAHCVNDVQASDLEIVLGDTDLTTSVDATETHAAAAKVVHSRYNGTSWDGHDVALLRLSTTSAFAPVRLGAPTRLLQRERICRPFRCRSGRGLVFGWGKTTPTTESDTLRQGGAELYDRRRATFWRAKTGMCQGDSGGPLVVTAEDGTFRQVGLASFMEGVNAPNGWCSRDNWDFYTDVGSGGLHRWVLRVMNPSPPPPPPGPTCNNPTKPSCNPDNL